MRPQRQSVKVQFNKGRKNRTVRSLPKPSKIEPAVRKVKREAALTSPGLLPARPVNLLALQIIGPGPGPADQRFYPHPADARLRARGARIRPRRGGAPTG